MSAAAPALEALPGGRPIHEAAPHSAQPVSESPWASRQRALFENSLFQNSVPSPKVVPIPTLAPMHPSGGAKSAAAAAPALAPRPARGGRQSQRSSSQRSSLQPSSLQQSSLQQSLDFDTSLGTRPVDMELDTVIYCDAPVALPLHRFIAAAVDASMVLIAMGLFLGVFLLSGGRVVFNQQVIPVFVAMGGLMWALYHTFWCMANGDTPGMRSAGLQVLNFDGRPANRKQRGLRQTAFVLSALSAGVGLFWAFVDEENLTWHDHISKTFPTPGQ